MQQTTQIQQQALNLKNAVACLTKRSDMRMFAEIEQNLLQWIKKTEYFKKKNTKDADLVEIASQLRYESYPKDTIVNDQEDYDHKFWILLSGQVSVQCPSDFMRNQSLASSGLGMFWPFPPNAGGDSASVQKSQKGHARSGSTGVFDIKPPSIIPAPDEPLIHFEKEDEQGPDRRGSHNPTPPDVSSLQKTFQKKKMSQIAKSQSKEFPVNVQNIAESEEIYYTEIKKLNMGGSFGEHIFEKIKGGTLTQGMRVICTQECHFATVTKADYKKCLVKFEAKAFTKMLYFLQELPFFATWSKTQLNKVIPCFKKMKYHRGQVLFKEGIQNEDVFIVREGEFQAVRTMVMKNQNVNQSVIQYLRGQKTNSTLRSVFNPQFGALTKAQSITNESKTREQMQLFLFGRGQIFGEERFVRGEQLSPYTAVCASLEAECLKISMHDFVKKVLTNSDSITVMKGNLQQKEQKMQFKQVSGIYNHLWLSKHQGTSNNEKIVDEKVMKQLLQGNNEKREGLKQIVEGYPNYRKITKLIKEDEDNMIRATNLSSFKNNSPLQISHKAESTFSSPMLIGGHGPSFSFANTVMGQSLKKSMLAKLKRDSTMSLSPERYLDVDVQEQKDQPIASVHPQTVKASKPPKKAVMTGSKIYVSSKIVDALMQSKLHTDNLAEKRSTLKDQLTSLPKTRVIDENKPGILAHIHQSHATDPDELEEPRDDMDYDDSQYMSDRDDSPDDRGSQGNVSRLTMTKLSLLQSKTTLGRTKDMGGTQSRLGEFAASTIVGGDDMLETDVDTRTMKRSKMTMSRKSLKSVGVNEEDGKRKQAFNINQEDIELLPNKSFYNSDGTKIKILGTINNANRRNNREAYAFSPLIQHLLRQRNAVQKLPGIGSMTSIGTFKNQGYKSGMSFGASPNNSKKIEEKIVFMQVAGTMNVISNQKKRLQSQNGSRQFFNQTPFAASGTQKFPQIFSPN